MKCTQEKGKITFTTGVCNLGKELKGRIQLNEKMTKQAKSMTE